MTITEWQKVVHALALSKGWYSKGSTFGDMLTNIHAELSEVWEHYRDHRTINAVFYNGDDMKPCGIPIELADVVIRIMDLCEHYGIDLEDAMRLKHNYNKTRPIRHGGKRV